MKAEKLSESLTEEKVKMSVHTSLVIADAYYDLNFNKKIHRKTGLSTTAAYQLGLNGIREICIFMYKIASVGRGALSHVPLHKVFVFV